MITLDKIKALIFKREAAAKPEPLPEIVPVTFTGLYPEVTPERPVIAWWSGGADSAVVCYLCALWFGIDRVRFVFIGTNNEDSDTYRFKVDCEKWYGKQIETISNKDYEHISEVWDQYESLNVATGAICSAVLKRSVRQNFQNRNRYSYQAFGFDVNELNRAANLLKNYPDSRPIFPLFTQLIKKGDSLKILQKHNLRPPRAYMLGYQNNNCLVTGCVQGGIGYWQKYQKDFPDRFDEMAEREREHKYTDSKGYPVTICKDQSKGGGLVFLKPHPTYPEVKDISMMKGRMPESLMECNGFCHK